MTVAVPFTPLLSVAWAVKVNVPALVSLPANSPVAEFISLTSGGKLPAVMAKVYGAVPPVAVNTPLYVVLIAPVVGPFKVTVIGDVLPMVMVKLPVPVAP